MCNRYVSPDEASIERAWHIGRHNQPKWPANVYPRALGPFLRGNANAHRELVVGVWGLIPAWAKTSKLTYATNNARSEELSDKPTFRDAWKKVKGASFQRCPSTSPIGNRVAIFGGAFTVPMGTLGAWLACGTHG